MELILIIVALFVPPVAMFFTTGLGKHFWINIILTLLGYLPGVVHAVWYIGRSRSAA